MTYQLNHQQLLNGNNMKVLIISDIHGNIWALEKILKTEEYDILICLGDLVDYGPYPDEVVQMIKDKANYTVMGNHDYSLAFETDCPGTTEEYKKLTLELRKYFNYNLSKESVSYLKSLPLQISVEIQGKKLHLVHSSVKDPLGDYVTFKQDIELIKDKMLPEDKGTNFVLYGHTHLAGVMNINGIGIVNPGSVGFPRDIPYLPTYAVFENGTVSFKKIDYDVQKLISEFKRARVPEKYQRHLLGEMS